MPSRPQKHQPAGPDTARLLPAYDRQAKRAMHTGSKAWREIRAEVLARDLYRCCMCKRLVAGKGEAHVDHIDGDSSNNPPDGSNWQTLCAPCHSRKTNQHDGGFGNR